MVTLPEGELGQRFENPGQVLKRVDGVISTLTSG